MMPMKAHHSNFYFSSDILPKTFSCEDDRGAFAHGIVLVAISGNSCNCPYSAQMHHQSLARDAFCRLAQACNWLVITAFIAECFTCPGPTAQSSLDSEVDFRNFLYRGKIRTPISLKSSGYRSCALIGHDSLFFLKATSTILNFLNQLVTLRSDFSSVTLLNAAPDVLERVRGIRFASGSHSNSEPV